MATSNAATTYLERRVLVLYSRTILFLLLRPETVFMLGWQQQSDAEKGNLTEVQIDTDDADYTRQQVTAANWKQSVSTLGLAAAQGATVLHVADAEAFQQLAQLQLMMKSSPILVKEAQLPLM